MTATRDFIPEGVDMTPNEAANRNRQAAIRTGANHIDFIPDPESKEVTLRPKYSPQERADRAMAASVARAQAASDADWDIALTRLAGWNARQAIEALTRMPQQVMELYIIAEETSGHRTDILSVFPTPRPSMYERYAPALFIEKFDAPGFPTESEPEPEALTLDDSTPSSGELPVEAPGEVFICFDCDHEPFQTAAGLKSHGRAKHGDAPEKAVPAADETPQAAATVDPQAGVDGE
jgi:hypothetical protein